MNAHVAFASVTEFVAPSPAVTCLTLSVDTTGFMNPQFSVPAVEASASQAVGSSPSVDESASPQYNEFRQEQIVAEQERVQQRTAEQTVHVPVPQVQEIVESVQVIPRELFPERIEEQIVCISVPPIVEEIAEVVQIVSQEQRFQQSTGAYCRSSCATVWRRFPSALWGRVLMTLQARASVTRLSSKH